MCYLKCKVSIVHLHHLSCIVIAVCLPGGAVMIRTHRFAGALELWDVEHWQPSTKI